MKGRMVLICMTVISIMLSSPIRVSAQEILPVEAEESVLTDRGAVGKQPVQPQWTSKSKSDCHLSASGKTLTASVRVTPRTLELSTSGTLYIERKDGTHWIVEAVTRVSGKGYCTGTVTHTGTAGKTYRARFSGTTGSDSVNSTSTEVTVR